MNNPAKQLVNIALQTATRNLRGVCFHAAMARNAGTSKEEVKGAVVMALHSWVLLRFWIVCHYHSKDMRKGPEVHSECPLSLFIQLPKVFAIFSVRILLHLLKG
jgi:hypothetical protein